MDRKSIPNYQVEAVLVTLFFFSPFGLISLVYATLAYGAVQRGDIEKATIYNKIAAIWGWTAVTSGIAMFMFLFWYVTRVS